MQTLGRPHRRSNKMDGGSSHLYHHDADASSSSSNGDAAIYVMRGGGRTTNMNGSGRNHHSRYATSRGRSNSSSPLRTKSTGSEEWNDDDDIITMSGTPSKSAPSKGKKTSTFSLMLSLVHAVGLLTLGFGAGFVCWNFMPSLLISLVSPVDKNASQTARYSVPVEVLQLTDELVHKLQRDKQLQEQEIETLRMRLSSLEEEQQHNTNVMDLNPREVRFRTTPTHDSLVSDRAQVVAVAVGAQGGETLQDDEKSRLRGKPNEDPNWEKQVHLINRSGKDIQLYWISGKLTDNDGHVEWILISDPYAPITTSSTFHFHARPTHKFGIQQHQHEKDDIGKDALIFTVSSDTNNPDQYIIVGDRWGLLQEAASPDSNKEEKG